MKNTTKIVYTRRWRAIIENLNTTNKIARVIGINQGLNPKLFTTGETTEYDKLYGRCNSDTVTAKSLHDCAGIVLTCRCTDNASNINVG